MTKQQDFLEILKDPVKAQIQTALDRFIVTHPLLRFRLFQRVSNIKYKIEMCSRSEYINQNITFEFIAAMHHELPGRIWIMPVESLKSELYYRTYYLNIL